MNQSLSFSRRLRHVVLRLFIHLYRVLHWHARALLKLLGGLTLLLTVLWAGISFWLFPAIDNYRQDFANLASEGVGIDISLGSIQARWSDFEPEFHLSDVTLHDQQKRPALHLDQVKLKLSWLSLLVLDARFADIILDTPVLVLRRDRSGTIHLADLPLNQGGDGQFGNWLLRQHRVMIRKGRLIWIDEREGIPALQIDNVNLRVDNLFRHHRFELIGTPPKPLASTFRLSGALRGDDVRQLRDWSGDLKIELGYADVAAWRRWLPLPPQLIQGKGGVSTWFGFKDMSLNQGVLHLDVSDAILQFATDLPQLPLKRLRGEATLRSQGNGQSLSLSGLQLDTTAGRRLRQEQLKVERRLDRAGRLEEITVATDNVEIADWLTLAEYLPLPAAANEYLLGLAPSGRMSQLRLVWKDPDGPNESFEVNTSFSGLNMAPFRGLPGGSNLQGSLSIGAQGGALTLDCNVCSMTLAEVFAEPLKFDTLTAKTGWQRKGGNWDVDIGSLRFSNADVHGSAKGKYLARPTGAGFADLSAELLQGRADAVWRYIPLTVGHSTRDWLRTSLKSGVADRAVMVLRGELDDFPWEKRKTGKFRVDVEARDVELDYANNWPAIHRIGASLLFEGDQLHINARQGNISGNRMTRTKALIPSLLIGDRLLIDGEVHGSLDNFIRFANASPVVETLDGLTLGASAAGEAQLKLKLDIPLDNVDAGKVAGQLLFQGNKISLGHGIPQLEQTRGTLWFSESGIRANNISASALGGRVALTASTSREGSIAIHTVGNASVAGLAQAYPDPLWRYARGETRYQLGISVRRGSADWWLESPLQGVQIDLPPPLRKPAAETRPLRVQLRNLADEQQRLQVRYEQTLLADLLFQRQRLLRGQLSLNPSPDQAGKSGQPIGGLSVSRPGLGIVGSLAHFNLDAWMPAIGLFGGGANSGQVRPYIDARIAVFEGFGKRLHDLRLVAASETSGWSGSLQAREGGGSFAYAEQERGRLQARLRRLNLPLLDAAAGEAQTDKTGSYPALDVEIENLQYKERGLGKLELKAAPKGDVWLIDRLAMVAPDGRLELEGLWNYRARLPQSKMTVRLDSDDLGKFLARLGFVDTVRRGGGRLSGQLAWNGSPHQPDLASMSGSFDLEAKNGQFAKVEPGVGRLLAIVSLQALPRRVTLDFRDVFSEGLAFDSLAGHFDMSRGVMHTESFNIVGPSAVISMKGDIDLTNQSQMLNVKVVPVIGDSVSIAAGFVVNPVVGLTALVLQKLFRDPLGQLMAYEYQISGKWSEPKVERMGSWLLNAANRAQQLGDAVRPTGPHSN